ncbi:MAG: TIGR03862 family flavoprotein [Rhodospirillaceae bacterium]|nr:TIGR03862 family flavoprotein [Rhodospirillaceae bacterium]
MNSAASVAIIGAGPAGLMAAEVLAEAGHVVDVYDAMPSAGRKFLMAGKGGLNITHTEPAAPFRARYGVRAEALAPFLDAFGPGDIRAWIHGLGIETFVGTSGRVFPLEMKAAPLLRAWLRRLRGQGVRLHMRHRWTGWTKDNALVFETPAGEIVHQASATVLALGGGSWPQLGSDGSWTGTLSGKGIEIAPLLPSNCGFDVGWSAHFRERFAGAPVKPVAIDRRQGEFIVTAGGIEGGLVYGISAQARDEIIAKGVSIQHIDLRPDRSESRLFDALSRPRGRASFATYLRKAGGLEGVKAGLVRELLPGADSADARTLAGAIKALPVPLRAARPIAEAISSAGGASFGGVDEGLMVRALPGVFLAGEMLDWEAPTGGYLLTACLATGRAAGKGAARWLAARR